MVKIHVTGFNEYCNNENLKELFQQFGTVREVAVLETKGFGFVHMDDETEANNAIEALHESDHEGAKLKVQMSRNDPQRNGADKPRTTKVFVGGLRDGCDVEELQKMFKKFGEVYEFAMMGQFAFVHYLERRDALAAIHALHRDHFEGSPINVELSVPKWQKEQEMEYGRDGYGDGGRGGRGRGRGGRGGPPAHHHHAPPPRYAQQNYGYDDGYYAPPPPPRGGRSRPPPPGGRGRGRGGDDRYAPYPRRPAPPPAQDPYYADPYAADPYEADPYAAPDPYAADPYHAAHAGGDPYSDPAAHDPYARGPAPRGRGAPRGHAPVSYPAPRGGRGGGRGGHTYAEDPYY